MKKSLKISALLSLVLLAGFAFFSSVLADVSVTLGVTAGTLTYTTWSTLALGNVNSSLTATWYASWSFTTNSFSVTDAKWTWWNLQAQIWNATAGSLTIAATNFKIKDIWAAQPAFIQWDNTCWVTTALTTSYSNAFASSAINLLNKSNNWKVCKYGVTPNIEVTVPIAQWVWSYSATLTITTTGWPRN